MEKIIEEMANDIFESSPIPEMWSSHAKRIAEYLYKKGYRKQVQGEWIKTKTGFMCSNCEEHFPSNRLKYCYECGAKMKGN